MSNSLPAGLDTADIRILAELQDDASLTNQELARRVHLSPAPCLRRVRRLQQEGYLVRTVAIVDAERVGLEVSAYAFVTLENNRAGSGTQFETLVKRRPEVVECVRLSGSFDYLVRVVVPSMAEYSTFLDKHLLPLPAVRSVNTSFELGVMKRTTTLPLPQQPARRTRRAPAERAATRP